MSRYRVIMADGSHVIYEARNSIGAWERALADGYRPYSVVKLD